MKLKEQYYKTKIDYPNSIILIKSGNFYTTFSEDAIIFNYLFAYQINDDKIGFPIKSLDKVTFDLRNQSLNYIIINSEKEIIKHQFNDENYYQDILKSAKKYEFENAMNQILIDRIKFLITENNKNYNKIKEFIDEL